MRVIFLELVLRKIIYSTCLFQCKYFLKINKELVEKTNIDEEKSLLTSEISTRFARKERTYLLYERLTSVISQTSFKG